jgi:radical SAM protein with 4Fe4S-binding SPASM domain
VVKFEQEPPFAVQVELSEGCNLRCGFCGINGIRTKERTYKFMTSAYGWTARVEFAMHGEPTMNPDAAEIVRIFRSLLPRASMLMLSNGGGIKGARGIEELMHAGLNTLALDEYEGVSLVPKLVEKWLGTARIGPDIQFLEYPTQPEGNPHARQAPSKKRLVHIRPISLNSSGTHATLNNHAGAGGPPTDKAHGKPCAKPFREISFRWDGSVAVCCNDWRGELACGNINKNTLDEIWNGPVMDAARRRLITGDRDFGPCKGCDALSYRTGLLPDKMGKMTMPKPTPTTNKILADAARKKPLTAPVVREWEKK